MQLCLALKQIALFLPRLGEGVYFELQPHLSYSSSFDTTE